MVTLISKVSKGSKMDQVYLPKIRPPGFAPGETVELKPIKKMRMSYFTYNLTYLEPFKNLITEEIFDYFSSLDNIFIVGSFLEKGFKFNDIDILLIGEQKANKKWEKQFEENWGLTPHLTYLSRNSLIKGLETDPLFQMMMSRYLAKKREIFRYHNQLNYKLLDLHLLKSKMLLSDFDTLTGEDKYKLVRNMMAISLFLRNKRLSKEAVDTAIKTVFGEGILPRLNYNLVNKEEFLPLFKEQYNQLFNQIMKGINDEPK